MINLLADATLPHLKLLFKAPFILTEYQHPAMLQDALPHQDVLLCRSTLQITPELLKHTQLSCIATASSGIDHIDMHYLKTHHIQLFDAKGCNARAVADYVLASLAYLKKQNKIPGPRIGVMGVGKVGTCVIERLNALKFEVIAYDPLKPNFNSSSFEQFKACDVLCIHANLHNTNPYPTKHILNAEFFESLKPNTVIINAARGDIVDEEALLNHPKNLVYCTDVYQNEPYVNPQIIHYATLCTPHIAGHTIEAKRDAVVHISHALHAHFGLKPQTLQISIESTPLLFNPAIETHALKQAQNKHLAFLTLRSNHKRHQSSNFGKK